MSFITITFTFVSTNILQVQLFDTIRIIPHQLHFKKPAQTSRSVMRSRKVYFINAFDREHQNLTGWGEVAPLDGLSPEGLGFHQKMEKIVHKNLNNDTLNDFIKYPSFRFGMESAQRDIDQGGKRTWFPGPFVRGKSSIPINGLIWMGDKSHMLEQIRQKLSDGYPCLKLKIGGIDFNEEIELLYYIRQEFSPEDLELRLDANGSFQPDEVEEKLKKLSKFTIHSIEQPIPAGNHDDMAQLCDANIIPIALDEELIGLKTYQEKETLLNAINPQYLIFKPSLIGGLAETKEYITLCKQKGIDWWITSALESNVGLNILAQFCDHLGVSHVQGLGTGKLFDNNIGSPLREENGKVFSDPSKQWVNFESFLKSH